MLTDRISNILFCPTIGSVQQLKREGITKGVHLVGDVMADILLQLVPGTGCQAPGAWHRYYLVTIHRNTNTDNPNQLKKIFQALASLDRKVIFPMHPRTRNVVRGDKSIQKIIAKSKNLKIMEPVSYFKMLELEKNSEGIITDSGGIQKEAFLLGVPCLTLRTETEWPETVHYGRNRLCSADSHEILNAFSSMKKNFKKKVPPVYGRGNAAEKILSILNSL